MDLRRRFLLKGLRSERPEAGPGDEASREDPTASTIMIVDDEPSVVGVLESFLEGQGYERFVTTTDSRRAYALLAAESPDLLLLDLNMPHVGGFEILEAIRREDAHRHTPVVILTSSTDADTKLRALELGATDFLGKPVDPSELALRLRNTLNAKAYQDRLIYYDGVTGLPNRRSFTERTSRALQRARHDGASCSLLHIALGRFQRINDTLGHRVGDALLQAVSQRIAECVRASDFVGVPTPEPQRTLSRLEGIEFALFLPEVVSPEQAAQVARRVIARASEPFHIEGNELFLTCTVGISLFPEDGEEMEALLGHARLANTKHRGHNAFAFYSRSLDEESFERLSLENQLLGALDREEMVLHYQPKLDIASGRVIGSEALMRWQHPQLGLVAPGRFIPIAEDNGLIVSLGEWALHAACRQAREWEIEGLATKRVSVNVSSHQFRNGDLLETVQSALSESGLDPQHLVLELTEGAVMENPREASETLRRMREMGLQLSIDDFGTGYSSLSYLTRFSLNELKIDRSFVQGIPGDEDGAAIVSTIIAMAHGLGLRVVAEGVETEEQLAFLRERGCEQYQGFLFSKAVPPEACPAVLEGAPKGD